MPRPVDTPPSSSTTAPPDSGSFLCERIQQFRQRMRSRCIEAHRAAASSESEQEATSSSASMAIPCLLQQWRKRIEAMDDTEPTHRHRGGYSHHHFSHNHHRRPCYSTSSASSLSSSSSSTESDDQESTSSSPPPACSAFPFRGPRLLHPKLERQQATCSLSGIWSSFSSLSPPPPPSPGIYAKPRHRQHPYARCYGRGDADDHRKSSNE